MCLCLSTVFTLCEVLREAFKSSGPTSATDFTLPISLSLQLLGDWRLSIWAQERARKLHGWSPNYRHTTVGTLKYLASLPLVPVGERRHHRSPGNLRIPTYGTPTVTLQWLHISKRLAITFDSTICPQ